MKGFHFRIVSKWKKYNSEAKNIIENNYNLIIGLYYYGRLIMDAETQSLVIVESKHEAMILRSFTLLNWLPRFKILVLKKRMENNILQNKEFLNDVQLICTCRTYIKNYQYLVVFRLQNQLLLL
jgi:hypothetical protein